MKNFARISKAKPALLVRRASEEVTIRCLQRANGPATWIAWAEGPGIPIAGNQRLKARPFACQPEIGGANGRAFGPSNRGFALFPALQAGLGKLTGRCPYSHSETSKRASVGASHTYLSFHIGRFSATFKHKLEAYATFLGACVILLAPCTAKAQNTRCDPTKVVSTEACAKCHVNEVQSWKLTPHYRTFDELGRKPEANQICKKLGLRSAKRSDVCIDCHFTLQQDGDKLKPVSGISCESCHGAAADWMAVHNDYGGALVTRESETPEHAIARVERSEDLGMQNTRNLYAIASSCFNCHTVPNEKLVNVGGHVAGTADFELVRWSQGQVRHNYLRTGGTANATSDIERRRVMFVVGLIVDLEYSTRATAKATEKSSYGVTVASRAASASYQLFQLQSKLNDPEIQSILTTFSKAELRVGNAESLHAIADEIKVAGERFCQNHDGTMLAAVDPLLPDPSEYK